MSQRKRVTVGPNPVRKRSGDTTAQRGESLGQCAEHVTAAVIPQRCVCTWRCVAYSPTGQDFKGWQLKFRHAECPAKLAKEHA